METFDGMAYDDEIGWYDPQISYCSNGCKELAVAENWRGMYKEDVIVELICYDCMVKKNNQMEI